MLLLQLLVRLPASENIMFHVSRFLCQKLPIHSYTINTITTIITTITIIIINFKTTIIFSIISIITVIINFAMITIIIPVSVSVSSTSEVRVPPWYMNPSEFCLTIFLIFIGFRCNNLWTNIFIDLLLLTLVSFKIFQYFQ